jgi:hypothetical protein
MRWPGRTGHGLRAAGAPTGRSPGRPPEGALAALAIGLLLARNKVTHIYELVKEAGSNRQVEFDRPARFGARPLVRCPTIGR